MFLLCPVVNVNFFYCWWIIEVAKPAPSKKAKVTKAAAKEESSDDDDEEGI